VYPEGGFLWKRLEGSQRYAKKNGFPVLQHCTLPRFGAVKTILDSVAEPYVSQTTKDESLTQIADSTTGTSNSENNADVTSVNSLKDSILDNHNREFPLKWVIDATICYKDGKAYDGLGMAIGWEPVGDIVMHYKVYRACDIPRDEESLSAWLYERYQEKDELLKHFYEHGSLSDQVLSSHRFLPAMKPSYLRVDFLKQFLNHVFMMTSCYVQYYCLIKPAFLFFISAPFLCFIGMF